MTEQIWLYWFPVLIATVAVCAWVGRPRSTTIAVLGAVYWLAMSWLPASNINHGSAAQLAALLAGVAVIAGVGIWFGSPVARTVRAPRAPEEMEESSPNARGRTMALRDVFPRFDDWLAQHRERSEPWPNFGEFIRSTLSELCGARHIRVYRISRPEPASLQPLYECTRSDGESPSARSGIIGHVVTTGRTYYAGNPAHGELIEQLASEQSGATAPCVWCFAITQNRHALGVVSVGELCDSACADPELLLLAEHMLSLCWATLAETCRSRLKGATDPVSGVLTHEAFVEAGERNLAASYQHGEPVALIAVSIEGLRTFADNGKWEIANQVLYEASGLLKQRMRQDDEIGVFDGTRFLLLLRRVDSALAMLIVKQLIDQLLALCEDRARWGAGAANLTARCGVAGSGVGRPSMRTLIARATANCQDAHRRKVSIVSDLSPAETAIVQ
jgi:GGDEF domain-containing protein